MFSKKDIIYTYTRKQAIEDGMQALIYDDLRQESGIKFPVYFTGGVISLVEKAVNNKKYCNDWKGVVWDIFTMFKYYARGASGNIIIFKVIITGAAKGNKKYHTFVAKIGATDIDDPAPCITIMLPGED